MKAPGGRIASSAHHPERFESWRRRTATVKPGTTVTNNHSMATSRKNAAIDELGASVLCHVNSSMGAKSQEPNGPRNIVGCGVRPEIIAGSRSCVSAKMMTFTSIHHQYSLLLARPRRRNAWLMNLLIASAIEARCNGAVPEIVLVASITNPSIGESARLHKSGIRKPAGTPLVCSVMRDFRDMKRLADGKWSVILHALWRCSDCTTRGRYV